MAEKSANFLGPASHTPKGDPPDMGPTLVLETNPCDPTEARDPIPKGMLKTYCSLGQLSAGGLGLLLRFRKTL